MNNQDITCIEMSLYPAMHNNLPSGQSLISPLIQFNNDCGRRLRRRCTATPRPRRTASSSPEKINTHPRPCFASSNPSVVHSPPLCNSPIRHQNYLCTRSRNDLEFGLPDRFCQESLRPKSYFSSKPPSEPIQIIKPTAVNNTEYKFATISSGGSRCLNKITSSSLNTVTEVPKSHRSVKAVRQLLHSLLLELPLIDHEEVSIYSTEAKSCSNKSGVRSDTEHRSVSVQVPSSLTTISVGDSCEFYDDKEGRRDGLRELSLPHKTQPFCGSTSRSGTISPPLLQPRDKTSEHIRVLLRGLRLPQRYVVQKQAKLCKNEWLGSMRALRDSNLRLIMRQMRQLRRIERLNRTLRRICSPTRVACEN